MCNIEASSRGTGLLREAFDEDIRAEGPMLRIDNRTRGELVVLTCRYGMVGEVDSFN